MGGIWRGELQGGERRGGVMRCEGWQWLSEIIL